MKCPKCVELGLKSEVHGGGGTTTAMCVDNYYDEDGNFHSHDPNAHSSNYRCSNGHRFGVSVVRGCKRCGKKDEVDWYLYDEEEQRYIHCEVKESTNA